MASSSASVNAPNAVQQILQNAGLGSLLENFRRQNIDSVTICRSLSDKELSSLGLATIGDRVRFRSYLDLENQSQASQGLKYTRFEYSSKMAFQEGVMSTILHKLGFNHELIGNFSREKITADIVCHLSLYDFQALGVVDRNDIMKLRQECIVYGKKKTYKAGGIFCISKVTIESLFECGFSVADASRALGVSESTLYRKMRQYNISKQSYTSMADDQLDKLIVQTLREFPRCGEEMLRKLLQQKGLKIQRSRLRDCIHRLDKAGTEERKRRRLRRRVYNVEGPNHLWHIDTNHKLIRWHFVIAGGIDGFSRLVTFLSCTDNNKADTILSCFRQGVEDYGTPLRVRSDMRQENSKVAEYMINIRGPGRGSMLTGKSTHNQRIERLWRDVFDGVLSYYYDLFYFLEDEGILDILNYIHLFALHYVYLEKINDHLQTWRNAWNSHRIRTVKSTPLRLFTAGMMNCSPTEPVSNEEELEQYGSDDFEDDVSNDPRPTFLSPEVNISEHCLNDLYEQCPKSWVSENYGIDVYVRAKGILERVY